MRHKPYTNFAVTEDSLTLKTEQEQVKTNHNALEEIRKEQMKGREERPVTNVRTVVAGINCTFNEWAEHIGNLLKQR